MTVCGTTVGLTHMSHLKKIKTRRVNIDLPSSLTKKIRAIAAKEDRTFTTVYRNLLEAGMRDYRKNEQPSTTEPAKA